MDLDIFRHTFTKTSTLGDLTINDKFFCHTLEDTYREILGKPVNEWKIPTITAIPNGEYDLTLDYSNRFKCIMPHVLNVPGFEGIRIHKGNVAVETEGCLLVGMLEANDQILNSKIAYDRLFKLLNIAFNDNEKIKICYHI